MRAFLCIFFLGMVTLSPGAAQAQSADDVTKLINRLVELDSIDLAKDVRFRAGLEPSLHALNADESAMKVLANPYEVHGKNQPGAAGWYRVSFTVPEKIGKFAIPKGGYNLGVESNVLGSWEIYTYSNGKPVGAALAPVSYRTLQPESSENYWARRYLAANATSRAPAVATILDRCGEAPASCSPCRCRS